MINVFRRCKKRSLKAYGSSAHSTGLECLQHPQCRERSQASKYGGIVRKFHGLGQKLNAHGQLITDTDFSNTVLTFLPESWSPFATLVNAGGCPDSQDPGKILDRVGLINSARTHGLTQVSQSWVKGSLHKELLGKGWRKGRTCTIMVQVKG